MPTNGGYHQYIRDAKVALFGGSLLGAGITLIYFSSALLYVWLHRKFGWP